MTKKLPKCTWLILDDHEEFFDSFHSELSYWMVLLNSDRPSGDRSEPQTVFLVRQDFSHVIVTALSMIFLVDAGTNGGSRENWHHRHVQGVDTFLEHVQSLVEFGHVRKKCTMPAANIARFFERHIINPRF
jgi:hypothetical protein